MKPDLPFTLKPNHLLAFVLAFAGLVAFGIGGNDLTLWLSGTQSPLRVTLETLGSSPDPSNVHVTITDFEFPDTIVTETVRRKVQTVWIPLQLPGSTKYSQQTNYPVIVRVDNFEDYQKRLDELVTRTELTGVITSGVVGIDKYTRAELLRATNQLHFEDAIVINVDRGFPQSKSIVIALLLGAGFWLVAAHAFFSRPYRSDEEEESEDGEFQSSGRSNPYL